MSSGAGDQSSSWYVTLWIGPSRNESAASTAGSSLLSSVARGHQAPWMNPHDRPAGFNRIRAVPIAGWRVNAVGIFSVIVDMCCLRPCCAAVIASSPGVVGFCRTRRCRQPQSAVVAPICDGGDEPHYGDEDEYCPDRVEVKHTGSASI